VYFEQSADDAALVRRAVEGDTEAFEALVMRYQRVVFTVALRMLGDREDARDAAQNTFIKIFEKLGTYRSDHRFFSWMYRILVNECLNTRRHRRSVRGDDDGDRTRTDGNAPFDSGPGAAFEAAERRRDVRAAILTLPAQYRAVIVLRHFAALSYDEMGEALGIPARTVKSRLHTARQQLAHLLGAWSLPR
jgi:RNA polymerase sigma-70 factor (ECF subfamily)